MINIYAIAALLRLIQGLNSIKVCFSSQSIGDYELFSLCLREYFLLTFYAVRVTFVKFGYNIRFSYFHLEPRLELQL